MKNLLLAVVMMTFVQCSGRVDPSFSYQAPHSFRGPLTRVDLGKGFRIVTFDKPTYAVNVGPKLAIEFIKNPTTGRWDRVNPVETENKRTPKWFDDSLLINCRFDEVHGQDSFFVAKPVTVTMASFHHNHIILDMSSPPRKNFAQEQDTFFKRHNL